MHFGLNDIDPNVAAAFRAKVKEMWMMGFQDHSHPHLPERDRVLRARYFVQGLDKGGMTITARNWLRALVVGALSITGVVFAVNGAGLPPQVVLTVPAATGCAYWFSWLMEKSGRDMAMDRSLRVEEIEAMTPILNLTPHETAYMEALTFLAGMGSEVDRSTIRDILKELNQLMGQSRQLEKYRDDLQAAMGSASAGDLEAKRADLARRFELTRDPTARTAAAHSLQMLDERIAGANVLQPNLERVEAQLEAISEAFASAQTTMARLKIAPAPVSAPDLESIRQSITEVTGQAKAVEQAVQEVMAVTR
jgi:hypothetical protein